MYFYDRLSPRTSSLLDLVRWIAAELVVLTHVRYQYFTKWSHLPADEHTPLASALYLVTTFGHQAVTIFFVLSGFLVGGAAIGDYLGQRFSLPRYLLNRFARIYVVLIPALLVGGALDWIGVHALPPGGLYSGGMPAVVESSVVDRLHVAELAGNAANLQLIACETFGSNAPLWSLSFEWWYYMLFPLVLIAALPGVRPLARIAAGLLAAAVGVMLYPILLAYFSLWLLGVVVRLIPRAPLPWPSASAVVVVVAMFFANRIVSLHAGSWSYDYLSSLVVAVPFALLLLSLMHRRSLAEQPAWPLCTRLAGYSYSLYLTHQPMLMLVSALGAQYAGIALGGAPHEAAHWLLTGGVVLLLNAYAWLFARLTEHYTNPLRNALGARLGLGTRRAPPARPPAEAPAAS